MLTLNWPVRSYAYTNILLQEKENISVFNHSPFIVASIPHYSQIRIQMSRIYSLFFMHYFVVLFIILFGKKKTYQYTIKDIGVAYLKPAPPPHFSHDATANVSKAARSHETYSNSYSHTKQLQSQESTEMFPSWLSLPWNWSTVPTSTSSSPPLPNTALKGFFLETIHLYNRPASVGP